MLSTENVALREENDGLVMMRGSTSGIQDSNLPKMSLLKSLHICSLSHKELCWICLYALYNIYIKLVVLLAQLVGPFWRVAVTLGALMVPAWDNGDIRPCAVAPLAAVQHCNVQLFRVNEDIRPCAIALNCSKSLGMSGMKWYHRAQNDPGRHKGRILAQKCTPLF